MFSILFRASNRQIVDKKLSLLNSNFVRTLDYLNSALKNPAQTLTKDDMLDRHTKSTIGCTANGSEKMLIV